MAGENNDGNDAIGRKPIEVSECRVYVECMSSVELLCCYEEGNGHKRTCACVCPETQVNMFEHCLNKNYVITTHPSTKLQAFLFF